MIQLISKFMIFFQIPNLNAPQRHICFVCRVRIFVVNNQLQNVEGRRGCDRMVVGFTAFYVICAYHH
jgi:hypothetical protein